MGKTMGHLWGMTACLLLVSFGAAAAPVETAPCAPTYRQRIEVDLAAPATKAAAASLDGRLSHVWGRERMAVIAMSDETFGHLLRVLYPRGSINPGNHAAPAGGAGFELALPRAGEAACLSYRVRFPAGFAFARGGKLPGLYGGDAPRGCSAAGLAQGFSARLMWREDGAGEVYLYAPRRKARCGDSIARGAWHFPTGRWVAVVEEVRLNAPGRADGHLRLWIDGESFIDRDDLVLRDAASIAVDGLLFSTFFGGSDPSWASPADQSVDFAGAVLWFDPR